VLFDAATVAASKSTVDHLVAVAQRLAAQFVRPGPGGSVLLWNQQVAVRLLM
jgi:hypothetical protein